MRKSHPSLGLISVLLGLLGLCGCSQGPATGQVIGKVSFKGTPLSEGNLLFLNREKGIQKEAEIKEDGTYTVTMQLGECVVLVQPPTFVDDSNPGKTPPAKMEKKAPNIPQKYRRMGTTPLKVTIKPGETPFDIDMVP